jgi:hypothetical protein
VAFGSTSSTNLNKDPLVAYAHCSDSLKKDRIFVLDENLNIAHWYKAMVFKDRMS